MESQDAPIGAGASAHRATDLVVLTIPVLTVLDLLTRPAWGPAVLAITLLAFVAMQFDQVSSGLRWTCLTLALVTAALLPVASHPWDLLSKGVRIAALIAGLLVSVNLLSRTVASVPHARDVLEGLLRLPPGRRYLGMSIGSQFFGGLLGFAGIAMMMEAAARQRSFDTPAKLQAFAAIARGHSALTLWSPMYSNMGIVLGLYPGVGWTMVLPVAVVTTSAFVLLGTLLDGLTGPRSATSESAEAPGLGRLVRRGGPVIVGMLAYLGLVVAASDGLHLPVTALVIATAPLAAWTVRTWLMRDAVAAARKLADDLSAFRSMAGEVLMFLVSGCAGTAIGDAIPASASAAVGQMAAMSAVLACLSVSGSIVLLSALAVHPMLCAVIVGSGLSPALLGLPTMVHVTALLIGWGLAIIVTPFSVLSLLAARWSGVHVLAISLRANIGFVLLALLISSCLLGAMTQVTR